MVSGEGRILWIFGRSVVSYGLQRELWVRSTGGFWLFGIADWGTG